MIGHKSRLGEFISEHETELTYKKYPSETKFERASRHIQTGKKKGHWIWYMFPQAKGEVEHHKKEASFTSDKFAIQSMAEAIAFLENRTLGKNYLSLTAATAEQLKQGRSLIEIFERDAKKVRCSLILFRRAALFARYRKVLSEDSFERFIMDANSILSHAENEGIHSCEYASSFDNFKYSLNMGTLDPNSSDIFKRLAELWKEADPKQKGEKKFCSQYIPRCLNSQCGEKLTVGAMFCSECGAVV